MKILLIEDNEVNSELVKILAHAAGHEITICPDGPCGVEAARNNDFDVILLDIQLPKMDGFAVLKALQPTHADKPIIAVSSYAMSGDAERALAEGFTGYITKPIRPQTFMSEVEKLAGFSEKKQAG